MKILTFDIEEWALAKTGGYGSPERYAEYDSYLDRVLALLDERGFRATFFCTGQMAELFSDVVKRIHASGHEIGCHSYRHTWMNKMSIDEAREDTRKAVELLEQCIGEKVKSYRAPAFSIGESNKWMFEVLAENGITCDASVFPAVRDFGGFPGFTSQEPCVIDYQGTRMMEFPICLISFWGKDVAFSGGGYFRFFPYSFIKKRILDSDYSMCYFHIDDLLLSRNRIKSRAEYESYFNAPGTLKNRYARYVKSNIGRANAWGKFERLVSTIDFVNIRDSINGIDAKVFPVVRL